MVGSGVCVRRRGRKGEGRRRGEDERGKKERTVRVLHTSLTPSPLHLSSILGVILASPSASGILSSLLHLP